MRVLYLLRYYPTLTKTFVHAEESRRWRPRGSRWRWRRWAADRMARWLRICLRCQFSRCHAAR